MNAYNFRNIDKSIKPVNENLTTMSKTCPNVLRMIFSSNDNVNIDNTSTRIGGNPIYNVDPTIFNKFDPNRPVFYFLEYLLNNSSGVFSNPYNLLWLNMPSSNSVWYSNQSNKNILASIRSVGNSSSYGNRLMPYITDVNTLCSMSRFEFAYYFFDHTLLINAQTDRIIFAITFYQE